MSDDTGGRFPDGWEPSDDRGGADEDFASVVFDEDFIRSATIHEGTAVERLLAAAQARAETEAARSRAGGGHPEDDLYEEVYGPGGGPGFGREGGSSDYDPDVLGGPYGRHGGALRPYRGNARWHRPVAWLLALILGTAMVALAFAAVYRGASSGRQDRIPAPASTGIDKPRVVAPTASADHSAPAVSAVPRSPAVSIVPRTP
jgi:hypothetical protein